ncbi:inactive polyglycylase TTLL10 [Rana temporaria]|uniref:inactive polyglycylase TTLL10 n=1 Tax=Rana temporaria TaxID=8407 RepID=UPI001AAD4860|nr:inactive polyglycylase TTLL10 [Rana temporaria]
MQLKASPTETREEDSPQISCDASKQTLGSEGIKQHEKQMKTKDTHVNETTQQSRGSETPWSKNGAQEKVPDEASNQMRLVKIASISRKTPTARRKKKHQTGTDLQVLPRISQDRFETNDSENSEAAKMQTTNQKIFSVSSTAIEKKPEDPRGLGPFFYIGGSNGAQLVSEYCLNKGWQQIHDNKRGDYKLKWCEIKSAATYNAFREGEQLLYQIPNNKVLTTKIGLLSSLREYERVMQKISKARILKMADFFPETFRLDLKEEAETFFSMYEDNETWICKPTGLNQGRGIYLLKNQEQVDTLQSQIQTMMENSMAKKIPAKCPQARIVQRYIPKPLLLEGKKFDIRSYLLIASAVPYYVFFSHGYVRLTCNPYDLKSDDLTGHLTNQYMQKKNPLYSEMKEETVWGMERFNNYINENFATAKSLPQDWVLNVFTKRMQQIMIHCFLSVKSKLECRRGFFDLIGCDFLIDEDFKVWLLEMNCNPALHTNCEALKEVIPNVVNETLDLALEIFKKGFKGQRIMPLNTQRKFVLLYNGETNEQAIKFYWPISSSPAKEEKKTAPADNQIRLVKNAEKPQRSLKPLAGRIATRSTVLRSPRRTSLAMSPINMMGFHDGMALHTVRHKAMYNTTSKSLDGPRFSNLTEVGRTNKKVKPTPVAKISFTGPQKFRTLGKKTPPFTRRSTPDTSTNANVVILSEQNRLLFSRGSVRNVEDPGEPKLEDEHSNEHGHGVSVK